MSDYICPPNEFTLSQLMLPLSMTPALLAPVALVAGGRWAALAGRGPRADGGDEAFRVGRHLARAYPDRVAQAAGAPERWLVRTIDGRELEFRALRELQAAIAQATITRDDVLSRGGSRPRRLGSIAELEPFFVSAGAGGAGTTTGGAD